MIAKWKTEKKFMLRMAKRRGRLPEQEHLLVGDPDACLDYAKILQKRLPRHMEDALTEGLVQKDSREILDWIIEYSKVAGGKTSQKLEDLFVERCVKNSKSPYDFGARRIINYCRACNGEVSPKLEELIWKSDQCALHYAMNYNKRIPPEFEVKNLAGFDDPDLVEYINKFLPSLTPEVEALLIERPSASFLYAKNVVKGKLSDSIHSALVMKTIVGNEEYKDDVKNYLDFVKEVNLHAFNVLSTFDKEAKVSDVLKALKSSS